MPRNISNYIISILLCLAAGTAYAQKKTVEKADSTRTPFYNGFMLQADVASVVASALSNGVTYSYEAGLQVDLKHKYYPVVELGVAGANKTTANNIGFSTNAPFGRIGVDFNILKKKEDSKPTNNLFLVGLRLGMSNFKYKIMNATITDDYWGGSQVVDYSNIPATTKVWWEIAAGVRVEVIKHIYMGWTVRSKNLLTQDIDGEVAPWYIPGYGISASGNWGINYTIGYHF
ncbi:MAG: DUF6048 family protein [Paludibacter sp.]